MGENGNQKPTNSPTPECRGKSNNLSVSDWVAYLTSEKFGTMGTVLNVSAILVALVALIYAVSTTHSLGEEISNGILATALAVYLFLTAFRPLQRRGKRAEELLKAVMTGKLNEECIRTLWEEMT